MSVEVAAKAHPEHLTGFSPFLTYRSGHVGLEQISREMPIDVGGLGFRV